MVNIDIRIDKDKNETPDATNAVNSHWASLQAELHQSELTPPPPTSGILTAPRPIDTIMTTTVVVETSRILFTIDVTNEGVAHGRAIAQVLPLTNGFRVEVDQRELFKGPSNGSAGRRLIVRDYQIPGCSTYDWSNLSAILTPEGSLHVSVIGSSSFFTTPITTVPIQFSPPFTLLKPDSFNRNDTTVLRKCQCVCPMPNPPCCSLSVPQWLFR